MENVNIFDVMEHADDKEVAEKQLRTYMNNLGEEDKTKPMIVVAVRDGMVSEETADVPQAIRDLLLATLNPLNEDTFSTILEAMHKVIDWGHELANNIVHEQSDDE